LNFLAEYIDKAVKYGCQRNCILQDLAWLETCISIKAGKTETGFQQLKTDLLKNMLLTSLGKTEQFSNIDERCT